MSGFLNKKIVKDKVTIRCNVDKYVIFPLKNKLCSKNINIFYKGVFLPNIMLSQFSMKS
jgi:hypothetical protein